MKYVRMIIMGTLGTAIAGCGSSTTPAPEPSATAISTPSVGMPDMQMSGQAVKNAKGSGTVTAIDAKAGTITLDHGPIPEVSWPAMTMAFKAAPPVLAKAKVGDKVEFDLRLTGNDGEVTSLSKK